MTVFELFRLTCYVIASLALLYKALALIHDAHYGGALLRLFLMVLFVWYMAELTMVGRGIDTRNYRIFGTPAILGITTVAVAQAWEIWKLRRDKVGNDDD